jgi:hypothetical protein
MSRPFDLVGLLLLLAALTFGVWLGLTGPDISPIFTEAPGGGNGGNGGQGR